MEYIFVSQWSNGSFAIECPPGELFNLTPENPMWEQVCKDQGLDPVKQATIYEKNIV